MMRPDESARVSKVLAGEAVVANRWKDHGLNRWASERGILRRVCDRSRFRNPFKIGVDGTRDEVCDMFAAYLETRPDLLEQINAGHFAGKVLQCYCKPLRCHGDHLAELANEGRTAQ